MASRTDDVMFLLGATDGNRNRDPHRRYQNNPKLRTNATQASNQRHAQQVERGKRKQVEARSDGAHHQFNTRNATQITG